MLQVVFDSDEKDANLFRSGGNTITDIFYENKDVEKGAPESNYLDVFLKR